MADGEHGERHQSLDPGEQPVLHELLHPGLRYHRQLQADTTAGITAITAVWRYHVATELMQENCRVSFDSVKAWRAERCKTINKRGMLPGEKISHVKTVKKLAPSMTPENLGALLSQLNLTMEEYSAGLVQLDNMEVDDEDL